MVFPIVMYGCESQTMKKAECWRTDAFKLWCWRRLLRVPCTARRSNQSILKENNSEYLFAGRTDTEDEVPIHWPPDAKSWPIRKDPEAGKDWRQKEQRMTEVKMVGWHHWLSGHEFEQTLGDSGGQRSLQSMGVAKSWTWLRARTTTTKLLKCVHCKCKVIT